MDVVGTFCQHFSTKALGPTADSKGGARLESPQHKQGTVPQSVLSGDMKILITFHKHRLLSRNTRRLIGDILYPQVPFLKMWSKYLVPKPKDWGPHVEVAGFFLEPMPPPPPGMTAHTSLTAMEASMPPPPTTSPTRTDLGASPTTKPPATPTGALVASTESAIAGIKSSIAANIPSAHLPPELITFLQSGPPPVFVGFGSMVVDDALSLVQVRITSKERVLLTRMVCLMKVLLEGAALVGVRIIFQSGWTEISAADFESIATKIEERRVPRRTFSESSASSSLSGRDPERKSADSVASSKFVVARAWTARDALLIGSCSHDKLFPLVAAVIHHGGAGNFSHDNSH